MAFVVRPPWYRTLWAYLAYLLLLGGSAWAGLRWYLRRVEAQKRALEVLVAERTEQLTERTRQLEEAMLTDQLTGLRNRRFLENRLDADIHALLREYKSWAANKPSRTPPTVGHLFFMIDLDHFKQVNDVHGHAAGDRVLEQIAQLLGQIFRESDIIVRWGGEEFLAIARFVRRDSAASLAERIRTVVEEHDFDIGAGHRLKLTCSIGIACFPFAHDNPDALSWTKIVDIADHCLYAAKLTQRNAWVGACAQSERLSRDQLVRLPREPQRLADSPGVKLVSSIRSCHTLVWQ